MRLLLHSRAQRAATNTGDDTNMQTSDFYNDRKFCDQCDDYVPYLPSMEHSYCADCGSEVRLFSEQDWEHFHAELKDRRPRGGRPRKNQKKESA